MLFLTGFVYPFLITGIAQLSMKEKAEGSIISLKGKLIGSKLIGQKFENPRYFWPRPSAVDYNPLPSGGSNLGPISLELEELVKKRQDHISKTHGTPDVVNNIPSELLYASGSGLDPHISPEAAYFQVERIVKARNLDEKNKKTLNDIILESTKPLFFHHLAPSCVNVLELNIALDELKSDL